MQAVVRDLNHLYRQHPALHALDNTPEGFAWVDADNYLQSLFIYWRRGRSREPSLLCVLNFIPVEHMALRIGVPGPGWYAELFNSDAAQYGGGGLGNMGGRHAEPIPSHGQDWSITVVVAALGSVIFQAGGH
jgi:1,4-alpha-glucan branching enzyme